MISRGGQFFTGLDLGQSRDYTALAVMERVEEQGDWNAAHFDYHSVPSLRLRHLERVALGTTYPEVVERVESVTRQVMQQPAMHPQARQYGRRLSNELLVDATGVGRPVVDLLRNARIPCGITPVLVTGGLAVGQSDGYVTVPKRDLIVGVQVALQAGYLHMAGGLANGSKLVEEMGQMRVKISAAGGEQFGAWRERAHDDLVFAVALCCWGARRAYPHDLKGRTGWWNAAR